MKKQSFLKGAVILMAANAVSKILGAVFKIPLTYILGEEGMAVFNTAFSVYTTALSFIVSGMPLSLAKIISEEYALGHANAVRKSLNVSAVLLSVLGLIGTAVMHFFAPQFAALMNDPQSAYAISVISPSVFFVAVGVVYKSYYQGIQYMTPIGASQVIEAVIKLAAGYALALYMSHFAVHIAASGAVAGITVGEIIATAVLMMLCKKPEKIKGESTVKTAEILKRIFAVALPVMAASAATGALSFLDVAMVRSRLCTIVFDAKSAAEFLSDYGAYTGLFNTLIPDMRITTDGARWLYGAYSGYALTIFHLPTGIIGALCMGVFPAISSAAALGNHKKVKNAAEASIRMTIMLSLPCAAVMYLFPDEILSALFNNPASAPMLRTLAPCVVMVCTAQICTAILQGTGKIKLPLVYCIISCALKPVIGWFLIGIPELNIRGAAVAACICCCIEAACGLLLCRKYAYIRIGALRSVIKPLLCILAMSAVMLMSYGTMRTLLQRDLYALAASGAMGAAVYFGLLWLCGAVDRTDLGMMRKNNKNN